MEPKKHFTFHDEHGQIDYKPRMLPVNCIHLVLMTTIQLFFSKKIFSLFHALNLTSLVISPTLIRGKNLLHCGDKNVDLLVCFQFGKCRFSKWELSKVECREWLLSIPVIWNQIVFFSLTFLLFHFETCFQLKWRKHDDDEKKVKNVMKKHL